jgi:CRP-like cAMP-binding protein
VLLVDFGASAVTYRVRFWVDDFSRDETAKDGVRTRIHYEFRRRGIEIPFPAQVQYQREEPQAEPPGRLARFVEAIARVPVLARLPADVHQALASAARELLFAGGEVIVHESAPGGSMFIVMRGRVAIAVGAERREVAVTEAGGYFGEMSLLTGEPRTATVLARGDCTVLEIAADAFRAYVQSRPEVLDDLALAATARRRELDETRSAAGAAPPLGTTSLRARMREFFGL